MAARLALQPVQAACAFRLNDPLVIPYGFSGCKMPAMAPPGQRACQNPRPCSRRCVPTITYVLAGSVEHGDSLGNKGEMTAGDVQWMTAGSGILHQEMPKGDSRGRMHGFQLWANLPASLKMTDPRYQDIPSSAVPEVTDDDGTRVRVICGEFWGTRGPVEGVAADPSLATLMYRLLLIDASA
jgi:redox-sensitive bicupin YhaK (pirin superfamily)